MSHAIASRMLELRTAAALHVQTQTSLLSACPVRLIEALGRFYAR